MSATELSGRIPSVQISIEDCNKLERVHHELTGIKELLQDQSFVAAVNNSILADRLIDRYLAAAAAYSSMWASISLQYFDTCYVNMRKECDFATRTVTLQTSCARSD